MPALMSCQVSAACRDFDHSDTLNAMREWLKERFVWRYGLSPCEHRQGWLAASA